MNTTRFLHVANGTCVTRLIEAAGIPGARSIWADVLYEGPVPAGLSDAELVDVRARYLSADSVDASDDLRQWRSTIEQHDSYDELILWYEHDLFDQLNLIQLLDWIHERLPAGKPMTLVCIGSYPGRPAFKGLGELAPGELASLLDSRQPVTDQQFALAGRAWQAFRQPTPEALVALQQRDTSALPYLARAIARFLQEYPWTSDGLSRTERRLLQVASAGPIPLRQVFPRMHEGEEAYYVTDGSLAEHAEILSRTTPPLLSLDVSRAADADGLRGTIAITAAGRSALAGELDRVTACGIDRWLGGVRLQGHGPMWRWDEARQRIISR